MALTFKQKFNKKYNFDKDKAHSVAEISRLTGYKYKNLLKIKKKGMGAFYSNPQSVRKNVSSPDQWGFSRIYASVSPGSKSSKIDKDLLK